MNIALSNLIESILNPNGRFRTLSGIYAVRKDDGEPSMTLSELTVRFDTVWNGCEYTLKYFLYPDAERNSSLRELSVYTEHIECRHLTPYIYLENEMLVFDMLENAGYVDVVLQRKPAGSRLDMYLSEIASSGDREAIWSLLVELADVAEWLSVNDFSHNNICTRNLYASPGGGLVLSNYSRGARTRSHTDLVSLGVLAAALYIAACQPELYHVMIHEKALKITGLRKLMTDIAEVMNDSDAEELKDLLAHLKIDGGAAAKDLCRSIRKLASARPQSYAALENIASQLRNRHEKADSPNREKYTFIGKMHDMVMRAFDGSKWFYIDKRGGAAIPGYFVSACDFSEGRAVVETDEGYGMIDLNGRFVIEPHCDDVEWDSTNNVAIVTVNGQSGLYSREGESLTGLIYDQILAGCEGLFSVRKNGKYGFIRRDGVMVIRPHFDDAFGFRNGAARVRTLNREYLIDRDGQIIDDIPQKTVLEEVKL